MNLDITQTYDYVAEKSRSYLVLGNAASLVASHTQININPVIFLDFLDDRGRGVQPGSISTDLPGLLQGQRKPCPLSPCWRGVYHGRNTASLDRSIQPKVLWRLFYIEQLLYVSWSSNNYADHNIGTVNDGSTPHPEGLSARMKQQGKNM